MSKSSRAHIFALYYPQLSNEKIEGNFFLSDTLLLHRLIRVLRAQPGQELIFFNRTAHIHIVLQAFEQKGVRATIVQWQLNKELTPLVDWWLPLLDKVDWEEALSFLTILGATTIQPLITHKVHRKNVVHSENERLDRLMIAAAEQSKQFRIPTIKKIITLEEALRQPKLHSPLFFFDPTGKPASQAISYLNCSQSKSITCMIGPEGDLTDAEKEHIKQYGFQFYALTSSILRSAHAAFLGMGLIRSFIKNTEHHQV